jgi:hypothetical protein
MRSGKCAVGYHVHRCSFATEDWHKGVESGSSSWDFPAHNLAAACTVENVTEDELKNWLKPERDENRKVSDADLEKLIAKADWLFGVMYVFAVDQMLQSIGAAFADYDLEHLLEPDAEMQPAAIVKLVIERIGPDDFRNTMEAIFQRNCYKQYTRVIKIDTETVLQTVHSYFQNRY